MKAVIYYSNGKTYTLKGQNIEVVDGMSTVYVKVSSAKKSISNVVSTCSRTIIEIKVTDLLGISLVHDNGIVESLPFSSRFKTVNFI